MYSDRVMIFLALAAVFSLAGLMTTMNTPSITGAATSASTISSAVILKYFSINVSANLSAGIDFGEISVLPAVDHNASLNYNDTNYPTENEGNETLYFVTVETDSNTPVDMCLIATAFNTSGGAEIEIGNYTFANNQTNNETWPGPVDHYTMSTSSYVGADTGVPIGSSTYYRFWLDVPASVASGTYNNTVTFLGRSTGTGCP